MKIVNLLVRYLAILILGLIGLKLFYWIFLPLTLYPAYALFDLFYGATIYSNVIFINTIPLEIIKACVAGAAYYLLVMLNVATPKINNIKRIRVLIFSFGLFLLINILRIFFLGILYVNESRFFEFSHQLFWYLGSTIFIILIWFLSVKIYKIKEIPFYSDLKDLYNKSKLKIF